MSFSWWPTWPKTAVHARRPRRSRPYRPYVEVLEDRLLLSTFTVLNTSDSGTGSLRQAILDANNHANSGGPDVIAFDIAGGGQQSIALQSALPNITDAVLIDATTEPGFNALNPQPMVELDGTGAGSSAMGLTLTADGNTIRGLAINNFNGSGLAVFSSGNVIEGDYVGLSLSGSVAEGNGGVGIQITNGASSNTIGGTGAGLGNVVSANGGDGIQITGASTVGNLVEGNLVGTDASGTVALGNAFSGVAVFNAANNNLIGGTTGANVGGKLAGAGNLISGNKSDGVFFGNFGSGSANNNQVFGNYIGTDVNGTHALGNLDVGIKLIDGAFNNIIGGATSGMGNVVAASAGDGIQLFGSGTSGNVVQGNFVGTDVTGTVALGNGMAGVSVFNAASNNLIGGTTGANPSGRLAGAGNLISGNVTDGVFLGNFGSGPAQQNQVEGNYIGTDVNGTSALGNGVHGVEFNSASNNLVGGTGAAGNVIADNGSDGVLAQNGSSGNVVQGNLIGVSVTGAALANNGAGVFAQSNSNNDQLLGNTIEANDSGVTLDGSISDWVIQGNTIANNGHTAAPGNSGVIIEGGQGNAVRQNAIYGNAFLGIDLGNDGVTLNDSAGHSGPNLFQNFPVLTSVTTQGNSFTVQGTLSSTANTTFVLDFFANAAFGQGGFGQGQTYLGSATVTTNGGGSATFSFTAALVSGQSVLTATATDPNNNTSEFSHGLSLLTAPGVPVQTTEGAAFTGPVATFTDPDGDGASSFSAVIDWGDNHTSSGTITANGSGGFNVIGAHTYAEEGAYTVNVTINDADGATVDTSSTATVQDAPLSATSVNFSATEGLAFSGAVANFTDANSFAAASDFSATIQWGDGKSSAGSVGSDGKGGFNVTGTHSYADEGNYAVQVTISDVGGTSVATTSSANVADAGLSAQGKNISATAGLSTGTVTVATFTDLGGPEATSQYQAQIAWGDGGTSSGTIVANADGSFSVQGSHMYLLAGSDTIAVHITHLNGVTADTTSVATVTTPVTHTITATGLPVVAIAGAPFTEAEAIFSDSNTHLTANQFTSTINWGDGSTSTGQIVSVLPGLFAVLGGHTYAAPGSYSVSVSIADNGGNTATTQSTAYVFSFGRSIQSGQTATADYWASTSGQALINNVNGGPNTTALSTWLSSNFVNLFGARAGDDNLTGKTNKQVAALFKQLLNTHGKRLEARLLTTALNVYVTTLSLGGMVGKNYGFSVSAEGLGAALIDVGADGAAFGVRNHTVLNVYQALKAADVRALKGVLFGGNPERRYEAGYVLIEINHSGKHR